MRDDDTIDFYRMRLPHWEVSRGVYFVTIREHGSLPKEVVLELRELVNATKGVTGDRWIEARRRIFAAMENALDQPHPEGLFNAPEAARVIQASIRNVQARGVWDMLEYVVMPNHLHLLFSLEMGTLRQVMISFKRYTTGKLKQLPQCCEGRKEIWQREWFDHWSRSPDEDERIAEYICRNPVKARLVSDHLDWPWGLWNDSELQSMRSR